MRLFIAINFNNLVKEKLTNIQDKLRKSNVKGNYTRGENLHLTLVFLGEISSDKVSNIKETIDKIQLNTFTMVFLKFGRFRRDGGDILWIGAEESPLLTELYESLAGELERQGFNIEKRKFTPHLTLVREAKHNIDVGKFDLSGNIEAIVDRISLMKSERINGKLTYTEIYCKSL